MGSCRSRVGEMKHSSYQLFERVAIITPSGRTTILYTLRKSTNKLSITQLWAAQEITWRGEITNFTNTKQCTPLRLPSHMFQWPTWLHPCALNFPSFLSRLPFPIQMNGQWLHSADKSHSISIKYCLARTRRGGRKRTHGFVLWNTQKKHCNIIHKCRKVVQSKARRPFNDNLALEKPPTAQ